MYIISTVAEDALGREIKLYYRHFIDPTLGLFSGPWTQDKMHEDIYLFKTQKEAREHARLNIISEVKIEQA